MRLKKSGGASRDKSGRLLEELARVAAASVVTIGSVVSPALASRNRIIYGWDEKGRPFVIEDVSHWRQKNDLKWSVAAGCYVPKGSVYSPYVHGRRKANGEPHSGVIRAEDKNHPDITKATYVPLDMKDEYGGRGTRVGWPGVSAQEIHQREIEAFETARAQRPQEIEARRIQVAVDKQNRYEKRLLEGLREHQFIGAYNRERGPGCQTPGLNIAGRTVGLYTIPFPSHPTCIVAWYDEALITELSSKNDKYKRKCDGFLKDLQSLENDGYSLFRITTIEPHGIFSDLEGIAVRLSLPSVAPVNYDAFLSKLPPSALGPPKTKATNK